MERRKQTELHGNGGRENHWKDVLGFGLMLPSSATDELDDYGSEYDRSDVQMFEVYVDLL